MVYMFDNVAYYWKAARSGSAIRGMFEEDLSKNL